jgi:hypothetical protein
MDFEDKTASPIPKEFLEAIEMLTEIEMFAAPALLVAEKLASKKLGEKAGKLLHIAVNEIIAVGKPLVDQYDAYHKKCLDDRVAFIKKACGLGDIKQSVALRLLERNDLETRTLLKTIECAWWKWKAEHPKEEENPLTDLLKNLMNKVDTKAH